MFPNSHILYQGQVQSYEESKQLKAHWKVRHAVLCETALLFYEQDFSIIDYPEQGKLPLKNWRVVMTATQQMEIPCPESFTWAIYLITEDVRHVFVVKTEEDAQNWYLTIGLAINWSNYKAYCSYHSLKASAVLLKWTAKGGGHLSLDGDLSKDFATVEFLRQNKQISDFTISGIVDQSSVLKRLLTPLNCSQLVQLTITSSKLTDTSLKETLKCISHNKNLKILNLSDNKLTHLSIDFLFKIFQQCGFIEELYLQNNQIKNHGMEKLFPHILRILLIKRVDLSENGISDKSIQTVKYILKISNLTLESLSLAKNNFSGTGIQSILKSYERKRARGHLILLDLSPLPISSEALACSGETITLHRIPSNKPPPTTAQQRDRINLMGVRILAVLAKERVDPGQLLELTEEIASLDYGFPHVKTRKLKEVCDLAAEKGIENNDVFLLEQMLQCYQNLGFTNKKAEQHFNDLKPRVEQITHRLERLMNPNTSNHLKSNTSNKDEVNRELDSALREAGYLNMKGSLVQKAKAVQTRRDTKRANQIQAQIEQLNISRIDTNKDNLDISDYATLNSALGQALHMNNTNSNNGSRDGSIESGGRSEINKEKIKERLQAKRKTREEKRPSRVSFMLEAPAFGELKTEPAPVVSIPIPHRPESVVQAHMTQPAPVHHPQPVSSTPPVPPPIPVVATPPPPPPLPVVATPPPPPPLPIETPKPAISKQRTGSQVAPPGKPAPAIKPRVGQSMLVTDPRRVSFAKGTVSALTGQNIQKDDDSDWSSSSAFLDDSDSQMSQADQQYVQQSPTVLSSASAGTLTPKATPRGGGGNELDDLLGAALSDFPDFLFDAPPSEEEKFVLGYEESVPSSKGTEPTPAEPTHAIQIPEPVPEARPPGRRGSVLDILNRQTTVPLSLDTMPVLAEIEESENSEASSIPQSLSATKDAIDKTSLERAPRRAANARNNKQIFGRNVK